MESAEPAGMTFVRPRPFSVASFLVVLALLAAPNAARAAAVTLSIETPEFLIPVGSTSGRLTVFGDGCPPDYPGGCDPQTSGAFNALGSQTFWLNGNSSSTGTLYLDLVFFGSPLGDPTKIITDALLQFSVYDLDFLTDWVTTKVKLTEVALITGVNGSNIVPINLHDYLPDDILTTDDVTVDLDPITLFPGPLDLSDFASDPMTISMKLKATVTNKGSSKVQLHNTPEQLFGDMHLTFDTVEVPEPATLFLMSVGLAALASRRRTL
jgi:hypothetical protein